MRYWASLFIGIFCFAGCQWNQGPEELDRLVKEDPQFKQMITQRDQVHNQIHLIKEDLVKKKAVMDSQISKLRSDYDIYAKTQNKRIEQYRTLIDVNRLRLRQEIDSAEAEIDAKQVEIEGYEKTLADLKKVLKDPKGISFSPQEKKKWEERVVMLDEKIRPLKEQIRELKLRIRLKNQKIGYLN